MSYIGHKTYEDELRDLIKDETQTHEWEITGEKFIRNFTSTKLQFVELLMRIEDFFSIKISSNVSEGITFNEVIQLIKDKE